MAVSGESPENGTYEFVGETVGTRHGANPEQITGHMFIPHGKHLLPDCPRTFEELKAWLESRNIEGVVWHHPDGRMVKIKARDFGIPWGEPEKKK